ncbi:hypothetical protein Tco_1367336 [Tanacetum coccineum]
MVSLAKKVLGERGVKEKNSNVSNVEAVKDGVVPSVNVAFWNTQEENVGQSFTGPTASKSGPDVSFASLLQGGLKRKGLSFRMLVTLARNGAGVAVLVESIHAVIERYVNLAYGFFLGMKVACPVVANYVRNTWGVEPTKEVNNSNPFDVLNSVINDEELGTIGGTSNLASNGATSSGTLFWNVETSNISTTPIVDKIRNLEKLIIEGKGTLIDDDSKPLKKVNYPEDHDSEDEVCSVDNDMARSMDTEPVGFGTKSLLEQWMDSYGNGDYDEDPYDDDMYEGQDLPDKLQDICDNLDIRVRGRRKK